MYVMSKAHTHVTYNNNILTPQKLPMVVRLLCVPTVLYITTLLYAYAGP